VLVAGPVAVAGIAPSGVNRPLRVIPPDAAPVTMAR
jgi:hypothetical protein